MFKPNLRGLQFPVLLISTLLVGGLTLPGVAPSPCLADEPREASPWKGQFLAGLVGTWDGVGNVFGNDVTLERTWSWELADQFLRANMRVTMANGLQFRVLTYWSPPVDGTYPMVWMDEMGRCRSLEGIGDASRKEVIFHQIEEGYGEPPAWRRIVYRVLGPDAYVEQLFAEGENGWTPIGEFTFTRRESSIE